MERLEQLVIRPEAEGDRRRVEELHRDAFWNLSRPGCDEHYLAHLLRGHPDFIPELNLVAVLDGAVVGSVMYTRSTLTNDLGNARQILTFGPIAVDPAVQRRGIGKRLLERSFAIAKTLGYGTIVIYGNPDNYVARGFKSCMRYHVCLTGDVYPAALLVKELVPGFFDMTRQIFHESAVYEVDADAAEIFDRDFPYKEKREQPSQEEFFIHSHSVLR